MASIVPRFVKKEIVDGWVAENLYLMLLSSAYTPNATTHQYVSQVSANEVVDSGGIYPVGGVPLAGKLQGYDPISVNNAFLDANNVSIGPGATLNYRYGVIYRNTGNPATSPIRCVIDFVTNQIVTNGTTVINWNALGIIYIS
ncbi:MAG: hypothetical protein BWY95_00063 [Bacteroidetes bacterium ADurb.BinA104]|nr:MAG: hypothetical protein BWY95_00063 [Bacteroidetes bacterium ADurb.BinA104]